MKSYPPRLLDSWPGDRELAKLPDHPRVRSLFPLLHRGAGTDLAWAAEAVKTVKQQDDDTVYDRLYRRAHVLYGTAAILTVPKAEHLLALLDFTFDLARSLQTFDRHSLGYVVDLLMTTTRCVLDDLHGRGSCDKDLADVIDECGTYLREPVQVPQFLPLSPACSYAQTARASGTTRSATS